MPNQEKAIRKEGGGNLPLAEEAALLFSDMLQTRDFHFEQRWFDFVKLGEGLLPHAKNRNVPIDRDAFMRSGPGVTITDIKNESGDTLGWTFGGEYRTADGNIMVKVEKTDEYNGRGARLGVHLTQDEQSLSIWATAGVLGSGRVDVEFVKNGKKETATFKRNPSMSGPVVRSLSLD